MKTNEENFLNIEDSDDSISNDESILRESTTTKPLGDTSFIEEFENKNIVHKFHNI